MTVLGLVCVVMVRVRASIVDIVGSLIGTFFHVFIILNG